MQSLEQRQICPDLGNTRTITMQKSSIPSAEYWICMSAICSEAAKTEAATTGLLLQGSLSPQDPIEKAWHQRE